METPLPVRINEKPISQPLINDRQTVRTFRRHLGALNFLARDSRPDLSFAASWLGKQTTKLTPAALRAMARCLSFARSRPLSIPMPATHQASLNIEMFVDASMGSEASPYGTTGWVITANGLPVGWRAKTQTRVGRSSLKAELLALHDGVDFLEWMFNIVSRFCRNISLQIHCDSQDLVRLVHARHSHPTERVDKEAVDNIKRKIGSLVAISAMFDALTAVGSLTKEAKAAIAHVAGKSNPADALTKATDATSIHLLRELIERRRKGRERRNGGGVSIRS